MPRNIFKKSCAHKAYLFHACFHIHRTRSFHEQIPSGRIVSLFGEAAKNSYKHIFMLLDGHLVEVVSGKCGSTTLFMSQRERVDMSRETNIQNKHNKLILVATPSLNPLPPGDPSQRTDCKTRSRPMASSQARGLLHYIRHAWPHISRYSIVK